jgi:hypothetical protein
LRCFEQKECSTVIAGSDLDLRLKADEIRNHEFCAGRAPLSKTSLEFETATTDITRLGDCPSAQDCGAGNPEAKSGFAGNAGQFCALFLDALAVAKDLADNPAEE